MNRVHPIPFLARVCRQRAHFLAEPYTAADLARKVRKALDGSVDKPGNVGCS